MNQITWLNGKNIYEYERDSICEIKNEQQEAVKQIGKLNWLTPKKRYSEWNWGETKTDRQ